MVQFPNRHSCMWACIFLVVPSYGGGVRRQLLKLARYRWGQGRMGCPNGKPWSSHCHSFKWEWEWEALVILLLLLQMGMGMGSLGHPIVTPSNGNGNGKPWSSHCHSFKWEWEWEALVILLLLLQMGMGMGSPGHPIATPLNVFSHAVLSYLKHPFACISHMYVFSVHHQHHLC